MSENPKIGLYPVGKVKRGVNGDSVIITVLISPDQDQTTEFTHPGHGLLDDAHVYEGAIGKYGSAETIEQLDEPNQERLGNFYFSLFTLISTFPNTNSVSFDVSEPKAIRVLLETEAGLVYAWWYKDENRIFVAREEGVVPTVFPHIINPSEFIFALSITAEHARMGTTRFVVATNDSVDGGGNITVSFFDHEVKDHRTTVVFPIMRSVD